MKKLFLILIAAAALSFQACKTGTADEDNVIDDGMNTSETTIGSGSTRPSDQNAGEADPTVTNQSGIDDGQDTANTEMGDKPIETGTMPGKNDNNEGERNKPRQ